MLRPEEAADLDDSQLLRYSRHILLPELGIAAQQRLLRTHVLILGAGGLGSPAALYLAAAGVGELSIIDDDCVELDNLQRQILHNTSAVDKRKVDSAQQTIAALNPGVTVHPVGEHADPALLDQLVAGADVVLDCGDDFATRHALNAACVQHRKPLVSGAALRFSGQIAVYDVRQSDSPCYACVFPPEQTAPAQDCATFGVLGPLVGLIGAMQAAQAIKLIAGLEHTLRGRLLMVNLWEDEFTTIQTRRRPDCPVCSSHRT